MSDYYPRYLNDSDPEYESKFDYPEIMSIVNLDKKDNFTKIAANQAEDYDQYFF